MIAPVRTAPPTVDLIDLRLVREHLRIDHSGEDFMLTQLVNAAIDHLDGWRGILGRCISMQSWRSFASTLTDLRLPFPDVQAITSVKYLDAGEVEQTLSPPAYRFGNDDLGGYLVFDGDLLPSVVAVREDAVRVEASYGFATLPSPLQTAILMIVASWYEGREGASVIPPAAAALIAPLRRVVI